MLHQTRNLPICNITLLHTLNRPHHGSCVQVQRQHKATWHRNGKQSRSERRRCYRRLIKKAHGDDDVEEQLESNIDSPQNSSDYNVNAAIAALALPTLATLAADPVASLVDTAYLGRYGSSELAAVGVALSIFGTVTKLLNIPLLSVTTNIVATAVGSNKGDKEIEIGVAASTSLLIGLLVSLTEAVVLVAMGAASLSLWGVGPASSLRENALDFLHIKALGAPATLLLMVTQGVYRGLGDTKTPLWGTLACNFINVLLAPLLIFTADWGCRGAALATVASQAIAAAFLIYRLKEKYPLKMAGRDAMKNLSTFLGPMGLLALRTVAISGTFALATSLAARSDLAHAAAHQICLQLWLASSLLADSLAVAAQTLMAQGVAAKELQQTRKLGLARPLPGSGRLDAQGMATKELRQMRKVAGRTLQLGVGLGMTLATVLALGRGGLPRLFTGDAAVLAAIGHIFPWVIISQPINALAFVWDGILYGAGGFSYAAKAMAVCAAPAVGCMLMALNAQGRPDMELNAVWLGLTVLMAMRSLTIYIPYRLRKKPFDKVFLCPKEELWQD